LSPIVRKALGIALLVCSASYAAANELYGRVVGISDGDTITVLVAPKTQHKIRLAGIDAPERRQAFGQQSKQSLSELVFNREVVVETTKKDRNGRDIGKVLVDGLDVSLEQVRRGLAWHYKAYQREQPPEDRVSYAAAEEDARRLRLGLWQDAQPVPPWELRRDGHQNPQGKN